jgi:hypothetical protein
MGALIGGAFIGTAAVLYLFLAGRYSGISGMLRSAAFGDPDRLMDVLFLAGIALGGAVGVRIAGPAAPLALPPMFTVAGGVLVGFGTALGGGCTSGHGVCGLGRLSIRSLAAVATFVAAGMLTVAVLRRLTGAI